MKAAVVYGENDIRLTEVPTPRPEVGEIVETGELDPETIVTPGIYVNRIVKGERYEVRFE